MTWQLSTAKIYNGSTWVNAAGGADIYAATDGTDAPYSTNNVTITASATPHTKGAYVQIVASTGFAANRVVINCGVNGLSNTNSSALMDFAIGAAGSETVIMENVAVGYSQFGTTYDLPVQIPSGTRLSARMQSAISSRTMTINVAICRTAKTLTVDPSTSANTFGANTATSQGVTVTGAVATKGTWTQITSNSGNAAKCLIVGIQGNSNAAMGAVSFVADIGIGAAGSESVIIPNIRFATNSSEFVNFNSTFRTYFVSIPASSRISVRAQCNPIYSVDFILHTVEQVGSL